MEVRLTGALRDAVGGAASIEIEASTIRELMRKIEERYPEMVASLQTSLEEEVAVSIDGQVFRDSWNQEIPQGAEVFLMPRIPGG